MGRVQEISNQYLQGTGTCGSLAVLHQQNLQTNKLKYLHEYYMAFI